MPYRHEEMKQSPMQKFVEGQKVDFNIDHLSKQQIAAFDWMQKEHVSKKNGEPLDVATNIFSEFETKIFKAPRVRDNITGKRVLFTKKLEVMNEEFDTYIGALIADMIFKQYLQRKRKRENLECIESDANSRLAREMIAELNRTEHLVYVE